MLCIAASTGASEGAAAIEAGRAVRPVHWLVPPVAPVLPQTEAEKEEARAHGRSLPMRELLQPALDEGLPSYQRDSGPGLSGSFTGGASDVLVELANRWFKRFSELHPGVQLSLTAPPYAGSLGTKELIRQSVDFVFVSRELKPEDLEEFERRFGYLPTSIPVAGGSYRHFGFLDAMGFFVHPDNPLSKLDFAQIDAIFSRTRHRGAPEAIRTWGQLGLGGEWANKPVRAYAIQPWNGFEEFIRQRVLSPGATRGEWREDLHYEKLVFPLASRVANDRFGIGYSGLAYIDSPVKMLPLSRDPADPAIAPTYENVAQARYPLSRLIYFNINKAPGKPVPAALESFLQFLLSREGQQVVLDQAVFLPLRAEQAAHARELLAK
ncbi:MAG: Phosphate-binding protein PstS [Steroidobacteraceae bacterium]|nr:Phosphate-binding protein PstS [Steroidobacteraceae bacterium]